MSELFSVLVPLVNTNETESLLANLAVAEGQFVKAGAEVAVFETTKSTFELTAEKSGYVLGLRAQTGDTLHAGEILFYLSEKADAALPVEAATEAQQISIQAVPQGLRITQPAMKLAEEMGIDLTKLPSELLVTEKWIREKFINSFKAFDSKALVIFGGGGHAKSLIELISAGGEYHVEGILDDHLPAGSQIMNIPVLGGRNYLPRLREQGIGLCVNAVGGIGDISPRLRIYEAILAAGIKVPSVIHPRACIENSARLAQGQQIFFNAYIGSDVQIGFGCIVNTGAIVSHDCRLGDYVNLSPGAILAGAVEVGERTLIGMGVTVNLGVKIGKGTRIGNSAVVKADVPDNFIVRAGAVWPSPTE